MNLKQLTPEIKTEVLIETLPWLKKYSGERIVIKYGGNAMLTPELQREFARDVLFLHQWGIKPIVVHGGGPQISHLLKQLNIPSEFRAGLRVTTPEVMQVVRMVLTGVVQRELVTLLNVDSIAAVGISGEDAGFLQATKKQVLQDGQLIELGQVGQISQVNTAPIEDLLNANRIPVCSSIALNQDDPTQVMNVNADLAAAAVAVALKAKKLIVLTDVEGLYADWPKKESLLPQVTVSEVEQMFDKLESGMRPKMEACLQACRQGVPQATIVDGRKIHSMFLEIFTNRGAGTMVVPD